MRHAGNSVPEIHFHALYSRCDRREINIMDYQHFTYPHVNVGVTGESHISISLTTHDSTAHIILGATGETHWQVSVMPEKAFC